MFVGILGLRCPDVFKRRIEPSCTLYPLVTFFSMIIFLMLCIPEYLINIFFQKAWTARISPISLWVCHGKAVDTQSDVHTFPTAYLQLHKQGLIHPDHTLGDGGF